MLQRTMNTEQAADFLGLHPETLKRWRGQKYGPNYTRIGKRKIIYTLEGIEKWLAELNIET